MEGFPDGFYTFKITGSEGSLSASHTFTVTLVNPCPFATLTLNEPTSLVDTEVWRREDSIIRWELDNLATSSTAVNCGQFGLEFFINDDIQSALD